PRVVNTGQSSDGPPSANPWAPFSVGTNKHSSTSSFTAPPLNPNKPIVITPRFRANSTARSRFGEFPLAEITINRSPDRAKFSNWPEKTRSYPSSFASAVNHEILSFKLSTRIGVRPGHLAPFPKSLTQWEAVEALPPLPATYTIAPLSRAAHNL